MLRYYSDGSTVYDERDGMPVLKVNPENRPSNAEYQRLLDIVLKALNEAEK